MNKAPLAYWLHAFFHEWLAEQRNCSRHTVLSYRDTWRLYLRFVSGRRRRPVSALTLAELTADEALAFLKHVESERRTSIGTRNCRLSALRKTRLADHEIPESSPWDMELVMNDNFVPGQASKNG